MSSREGVKNIMEHNDLEISRTRRNALRLAIAVTSVVGAVSIPGFAFATLPADPTGGAIADSEESVQTFVITYAVPTLFTLTLLGLLIRLGLKWMKRGARAV